MSLAGSDGRVLGGGVAGMLVAATPVQVLVLLPFATFPLFCVTMCLADTN